MWCNVIQCMYHSCTVSTTIGSTTVVIATHGLHWKWQSLTPCRRHPSEPIEKIFGTIDHVIDLNNLAKFGFRKKFSGRRYTYPTCKGSSFFSFFKTFYALLMRVQAKMAEPILTSNTSFHAIWWESDPFLETTNIGQWLWPWQGQNPPFCFDPKNFDPNFLENGTR